MPVKQSFSEVPIGYCALFIDISPRPDSIQRYWRAISRHMKVLRAIEEGREDPTRVTELLNEQVRDCLERYPEVQDAREKEWISLTTGCRGHPVTSEIDAYYNEHRRYEDPVL